MQTLTTLRITTDTTGIRATVTWDYWTGKGTLTVTEERPQGDRLIRAGVIFVQRYGVNRWVVQEDWGGAWPDPQALMDWAVFEDWAE